MERIFYITGLDAKYTVHDIIKALKLGEINIKNIDESNINGVKIKEERDILLETLEKAYKMINELNLRLDYNPLSTNKDLNLAESLTQEIRAVIDKVK